MVKSVIQLATVSLDAANSQLALDFWLKEARRSGRPKRVPGSAVEAALRKPAPSRRGFEKTSYPDGIKIRAKLLIVLLCPDAAN